MLIAEYSKRRKTDGFNLFVRVPEQDANVNHYNNIFLKAFTDKYFTFDANENEFMFYELHGNLLYKYLYILNKFVLKCDRNEMAKYKQDMKVLCQKRLIKVDYRIFTRNSFTEDFTEDDIPQEILDEFSYLFTHIKKVEEQADAEEVEAEPDAKEDDEEAAECEFETSREQLEAEKIEFETLKEQLEAEKIEFETLKEQLESEKAEFETLKEQLEVEKVELETLKEQLDAEKTEFETLKEQLDAEKAEFETLKEQLETEKVELETSREQLDNDDDAKYNEMQREIEMLKQKLEFYNTASSDNNDLMEQNNELQNEYNNLLSEFEEYKESAEKQIEELKQYEAVDLSLYSKTDTSEIASLFKEFEERIEKLIVNNKDASVDIHRLRNTVTSLEMENTELRKENEEIYEKLAYCEKQFELIKQKYVKLQQLKHKYKTMVINSSTTNHIEELPFISKKRFSPIPDEPVRYPYKMN
jgi:chromosome segregation ATPase